MPIFRVMLYLLLSLVTLLPLRADTEWMIDSRENWDVIIRQFCATRDHTRKSLDEEKAFLLQRMESFSKGLRDVEKRSTELYYLFWDESQNDVLTIAMYARQISDLKRGLDTQVGLLQRVLDEWKEDLEANTRVRESLNRIPRTYLAPDSYARLDGCKLEWDYYIKCGREAIVWVDKAIRQGNDLQKKVNEIYEGSEKRRNDVMQRVIFTRCSTLWQSMPYARLILTDWLGYLHNWLEVEIPDSPDFWRNFFLLLICAGFPLVLLGIPVHRYTFSLLGVPCKDRKFMIFMSAWSVMILSLFCFFAARFMLDLVEGTFVDHIGHLLFAISWLVLALLVRVGSTMVKRCLVLYSPLMFQYLCGTFFEIAAVPYTPLSLFLPVISIPSVIIMIVLLFRLDCPLMDRIFGILSVFLCIATVVLSVIGLPYIGFTIIMVWFVAMSGLQAGLALTTIVRTYVARNANRKIISSMLFTLLTPAMWMIIICVLIYWTAGMYNRQTFLDHILVSDFIHCKNVVEISLIDVLLVLAVGFILQFVLSTIRHLIHSIYGRRAEMGLIPSFMTLATYGAWSLYTLFVLIRFDVNPNSILVVLGGMSVGIGFALKEIIENFISGIILLAGRQIRPGDIIEFNDIWGKVTKVSIRATVIETTTNAIITLPNSRILTKDFHNWTLNNTHMRRDIKIGVAYGTEIAAVREALLHVARANPGVLQMPVPDVSMDDFSDDGMRFTLYVWVEVTNRTKVPSQLREEIDIYFRKHGIVLSGPQLNVHLDGSLNNPVPLNN